MESADGDVVRIGGMQLRFLVDENQGSGELVMFEFTVPASARVPAAHYHDSVDEVVYGLEGTLTTTVDGKRHEIRPGGFIVIPRGRVHIHENTHDATARALVVLNPGSIGRRYFEETAAAVNAPERPDPARMRDIMLRHGLVPA
jgi:quercetin dioxygenase-like cupin family protein